MSGRGWIKTDFNLRRRRGGREGNLFFVKGGGDRGGKGQIWAFKTGRGSEGAKGGGRILAVCRIPLVGAAVP